MDTIKLFGQGILGVATMGAYWQYNSLQQIERNNAKIKLQQNAFMEKNTINYLAKK